MIWGETPLFSETSKYNSWNQGFFWGGKGTPIVVGKKTLGVPSPFLEVAPISRAKKTVGSSSTASAIQKLFGHVLFKMLFSLSFLNIALALGLAWWFGCSL